LDFVDLNTFANIDGFDVRETFLLGQSLIDFLVELDPLPKIDFGFLKTFLLVVHPIQLDLLDVLVDDSLVITNRFDPYKLVLALHLLLQILSNVPPPLVGSVGAVEDGDLVVLAVDEADQILKTHLCAVLTDLIALLILIIKKIAFGLDAVVFIRIISTYHILSTVVTYVEYLGIESQPV